MAIAPGTCLGPYEIVSHIGAGGMGEVWKARYTRLDRTVAIKVASEKFSERFEREARAVAALNHPNICTLHDVGPNYLVMEYIDRAYAGQSHPARGGSAHRAADRRSARSGARERHHPSRPQTCQYQAHHRRQGQGAPATRAAE